MQPCAVLVEVEHFGDGGDASVTAGDSLRMEETFLRSSQRLLKVLPSPPPVRAAEVLSSYSNRITYTDQLIEHMYANCVVRLTTTVTFESCDRDVICL